jgi:hypothetical protein
MGSPCFRAAQAVAAARRPEEAADGGLTVAEVVAAFHRRRVLPLMARRLRLDQMEEGAPLEGCQMSDTSLTAIEVTRRETYTVATGFTVADLNWVQMRPTQGYISLVCMTFLPIISLFSMGLLICY